MGEYLLRSIREEAVVTGKHGRTGTTASVGITLFSGTEAGVSAGDLLAEADIAMYDAKESGRDRCVLFATEGREARMATRLNWVERIRGALARTASCCTARPSWGCRTTSARARSCCCAWWRRTATLVAPGDFLHVAERFDLIQAIDRWVIRHAVELLARMEQTGPETVLEVNVSAKSLTDGDLPGAIARLAGGDRRRSCRPGAGDDRDGRDRERGAGEGLRRGRARAGLRVRASTTSAPASRPSTTSSTWRSTT